MGVMSTQANASSPNIHLELGGSESAARSTVHLTLATLASAALAACGGGGAQVPPALFDVAHARDEPALLRAPVHQRQALTPPAPNADTLMDWAEQTFPSLFPPHQATVSSGSALLRYYPATGNYINVMGQDVYVMGPFTGGALIRVGQLADFAGAVYPAYGAVKPATDKEAARFLLHAQFGTSDEEIASVLASGYAAWLQQQFQLPLGQTSWDWLDSRGYTEVNKYQYYFGGFVFELAAWKQFFTASDGLRKRVALALTEYFVVSNLDSQLNWGHMAYATYWDMLNENAFGNFRVLLEKVTLSAAMGAYLNTAGNQKEDPTTGRAPDENYAREVMQLFTIGLQKLNLDGSPMLDGQGLPIPTYLQDDVTNLSRVFTGYEVDISGPSFTSVVGGYTIPTAPYTQRAMKFTASRHSTLEARFLGTTVPAGTPGEVALQIALDALFSHPNVGPFFGRQMIQRLVTSNPSPAYVSRVASAFNNNGQGVRGDLKAVFAAILLDSEALGGANLDNNGFGKLREPTLRFVQWGRTFRMTSKFGSWKYGFPYGDAIYDFGQRLFWSPTVFNFFRPGYVPPNTAMAALGGTAPEFQITNESTVAQYVNALASQLPYGPYVFAPDRPDYDQTLPSPYSGSGTDLVLDYSREIAIAQDAGKLVERLSLLMTAGQLSATTQAKIKAALETVPITQTSSDEAKRQRVVAALTLIMVCPEYLVQK
jgi:uncharacterized protein (DUF1800 family)